MPPTSESSAESAAPDAASGTASFAGASGSTISGQARIVLTFAAAAAAYVLCLYVAFPGYVDPLYPLHSDFYLSPGLSIRNPSLWAYLGWPRPIGYLTADLLGRLGLKGFIGSLILITLVNATLTVELVRRVTNRSIPALLTLLYCFLLFSHPQFYLNYIHDTLATLSYLYLIVGMLSWYAFRRNPLWRYLVICGVTFVLLAFTKETYLVSAGCFWLAQILLCNGTRRKTAAYLLACLVVLGTSGLYLNLHSAESFIQLESESSNPYYIDFALFSLLQVFGYYAARLFTPTIALAAFAALALLWRREELLFTAGSFAVAGLCALAPLTPLPQHLDYQYAWTPAALVLSPVLFLTVYIRPGWSRSTLALSLSLVVIVPLTVAANHEAYSENRWATEQEQINRNIMAAYPRLKSLNATDKKILVTGLNTPVHPFYVRHYVRREFGPGHEWTVAVPRSRAEIQEPIMTLAWPENINVSSFDRAFAFDNEGNLAAEWSREQLSSLSSQEEAVIAEADLVLHADLKLIRNAIVENPDDWHKRLTAGIIFWEWGQLEKAQAHLEAAAESNGFENPYPMFFLGQVHEWQGNYEKAQGYYEQAVDREGELPNPTFRDALAQIQRKLAAQAGR